MNSVPRDDTLQRMVSLQEAQSLVPFPLFQLPGPTQNVTVRLGSRSVWPSVRTTHRRAGVTYTVKQYAMDWFGHFGAPNKMYCTRPDDWEPYGATTDLGLDPKSAFHGRDWTGSEAASLVTLGVHIELRVTAGALGQEGARQFFREVRPLNPIASRELSRRPLTDWNWTLQAESVPNSIQGERFSLLRWAPYQAGDRAEERSVEAPKLQGWKPDSIGIPADPAGTRATTILLYRSEDLETTLELTLSRPSDSVAPGAIPQPPMFASPSSELDRIRIYRSPAFRWAKAFVGLGSTSAELTIPPGRSTPQGNERMVQSIVHHFTRRGG
jgi:hypothetical protein